jgi:hypothetical protein
MASEHNLSASPLVLGGVGVSLGPMEGTDPPFLPKESTTDGKLACGSGGLMSVVARVRLDPVSWRDASSGLFFALEVLEVVDDFGLGRTFWTATK